MASPIKETPILYGEDARKFEENMRIAESPEGKVSKEEYDRAMKAYNEITLT